MTSLIPTVIALSQFFVDSFPNFSWYPNWYLGNPFQYLIGPVVPILLTISNFKFLISNFQMPMVIVYFILITIGICFGGVGLYFLLREFGVGKIQAIFSGLLYVLLPVGWMLLNYQNGLNHITLSLLPWVLILYRRFLLTEAKRWPISTILVITLSLLVDVSGLLAVVVGMIAVAFSLENKLREQKIIQSILMVLLAVSLSSFWYTPKFWWVILTNPSLGGAPLLNLSGSVFQLLLNLLPVVAAILVVKWKGFRPRGHLKFASIFLGSFLFLSLIRFVSDPKFVLDWISFGLEVQLGVAIMLGTRVWGLGFRVILVASLVVIDIFIAKGLFQVNQYQNHIESLLNAVPVEERVFLSGSSVFFINTDLNGLMQTRGGVDQASVHPWWRHGAYQIREGVNSELSKNWLRTFGVSWILVHDSSSKEPFKDFKNPEKFFGLKLVDSKEGDSLYKAEDSSLARVAKKDLLMVKRPKDGADSESVGNYVINLDRNITLYNKAGQIIVTSDLKQDEIISLAISFDSGWKILEGQGHLVRDPLGNMVIIPKNQGSNNFVLEYKINPLNYWIVAVLSLGLALAIAFPRKLPNLKIGLEDEE